MLARAEALHAAGGIAGDPRRADRRLRAGAPPEAAGADPARPDRARAQHPRPTRASAISAAWSPARPMPSSAFRRSSSRARSPAWRSPTWRRRFSRSLARSRPGSRHRRLGAHGSGVSADATALSGLAALGSRPAGHRSRLHGLHARFRLSTCARGGRALEGPRPGVVCNERIPANSAPARATATRTSPSPRASSPCATVRRSSPFTSSCGRPTTSPTMPPWPPPRSSSCSTVSRRSARAAAAAIRRR